MKKTLVVLALAVALVLAMGAAPAFAKYAGFKSTTQYLSWNTASSMASQNADAALMASSGGPHGSYATTTIKCAVCHSVHRGENKILSGAAACAYCHTTSYYGGGAVSTKLVSWKVSAGAGPHSGCTAAYCHGGVHGVGGSSYPALNQKLFSNPADATDIRLAEIATANWGATYQLAPGAVMSSTGTYLGATNSVAGANRVVATAALCGRSGCHTDSAFGIITAGAKYTTTQAFNGTSSFTGHRVVAPASTNWDGTKFDAQFQGQIAWTAVSYCNSCHDLKDDNNSNLAAFPHAIDDVISASQSKAAGVRSAVWLTAGAYAGQTTYAVSTYNDYTGSPTVASAAGSTVLDGQCLKCHRTNVGAVASGVGFTY